MREDTTSIPNTNSDVLAPLKFNENLREKRKKQRFLCGNSRSVFRGSTPNSSRTEVRESWPSAELAQWDVVLRGLVSRLGSERPQVIPRAVLPLARLSWVGKRFLCRAREQASYIK